MRVVSFEVDGGRSYGAVDGDYLIEASDAFRSRCPDLRSVLEAGALADLEADSGGQRHALAGLRFLPTIPNPRKVLCVGINYRPHVEEMGRAVPERPTIFVRFPGDLVGHRCPVLRPTVSEKFDYEGELGDLIFDVPALVEYCTTFTDLLPGDVIATGTPGGVGAARKPPVWLKPGDHVAVDIPCVGRLENTVASA